MDNIITSQRTRRGSQERWSASATTKLYDAEGNLTTDPAVAVKAQVRWRYDAKQRKATFSGPDAQLWFALEIVETLDLGSEDESYGK